MSERRWDRRTLRRPWLHRRQTLWQSSVKKTWFPRLRCVYQLPEERFYFCLWKIHGRRRRIYSFPLSQSYAFLALTTPFFESIVSEILKIDINISRRSFHSNRRRKPRKCPELSMHFSGKKRSHCCVWFVIRIDESHACKRRPYAKRTTKSRKIVLGQGHRHVFLYKSIGSIRVIVSMRVHLIVLAALLYQIHGHGEHGAGNQPAAGQPHLIRKMEDYVHDME